MARRRRHPTWVAPAAAVVPLLLALVACSQSSGPSLPDSLPPPSATDSATVSSSPSPAVSVAQTLPVVAATTTSISVDTAKLVALTALPVHVRVRAKDSITAPTGVVTLLDGGRPVGSTPVGAADFGSVDVVVTLHGGTHGLTARYSGDKDHKASLSTRLPVLVRPVGSSVAVTAKRNPKNAREFRLAARVRTHTAGRFASGTVTFVVAGRSYAVALDSLGHAAFHLVLTRGRTYTVVARYAGSADVGPSTGTTTFTV